MLMYYISSKEMIKREIMKRTERNIFVYLVTYNRVNYLKLAIESILNQTYRNFELIIVDDLSTDGSVKTIEEYQRKDKRIHLLKNIV